MKRTVRVEINITFEDLSEDDRAECARGMGIAVTAIETLADYGAQGLASVLDGCTAPEMFTEFFGGSDVYAQIVETEVISAQFVPEPAEAK